MKLVKRTAWGFAGVMALVAGGVVAVAIVAGGAGQSAIEAWVGRQLKSVVAANLKPTLRFESLDYQAPLTVELKGMRLTADDPDRPGQRIDIIDADRIRLRLAEMPSLNSAIKLASLELDGGTIRLAATQGGGLVGFSDLMLEGSTEEGPPLSEVLQITRIVIRDGTLEYDAREPGAEPMVFDQINTTLNIDPGDGAVYGLDLDIERSDMVAIKLDGAANLDTMRLAIQSLKTDIDLSREQDRYLPPQVQAFIKEYDLVGKLRLDLSGDLDIEDVIGSTAKATVTLSQAHGKVGGYRLPIETFTVDATMADRAVKVASLSGSLLGGEISGDGGLGIEGAMPATLNLSGNGLRLQDLVADDTGEQALPLAGLLDLQVNAQAPLSALMTQMAGAGELRVSEGRIARLPLVSSLIDLMSSSGDLKRKEGEPVGNDRAQIVFDLRGDHAYLSQADVVGTWFAMRGRGKVFFDQELSMNVNAGPLEKMQESLGAIGRVLGKVTDGVLAYRVSGPFDDVSIRPVPLGGLIGAPGDDE